MLGNEAQACEVKELLVPKSAANTSAATGTAIDITAYEGDLLVTQHVGALTGSIDGKLQQCDDAGGTNAADISGAVWAQLTAAGIGKITIPAGSLSKKFVRYVGVIVTGPALVAVQLHARPKYTTNF